MEKGGGGAAAHCWLRIWRPEVEGGGAAAFVLAEDLPARGGGGGGGRRRRNGNLVFYLLFHLVGSEIERLSEPLMPLKKSVTFSQAKKGL